MGEGELQMQITFHLNRSQWGLVVGSAEPLEVSCYSQSGRVLGDRPFCWRRESGPSSSSHLRILSSRAGLYEYLLYSDGLLGRGNQPEDFLLHYISRTMLQVTCVLPTTARSSPPVPLMVSTRRPVASYCDE